MSDAPTKRQALINQLRTVLGDLQSPAFFDYNDLLEFEIGDIGYCFTEEQLNELD